MPDRRRGEVLDGEAGSLRQVGHRRLARVVLPVRVGDEADRGIEAQELLDRAQTGLVERQAALDALEQVEHEDRDEAERQDADRVGLPALLGRLIDAGDLVDRALDRAEDGRQDDPLALEDVEHVAPEEGRDEEDSREQADRREDLGRAHALGTLQE